MTKFYLIRHGEADYTPCEERKFIGQGCDLAPLSDQGIEQIKRTSRDIRLKGAQWIVSSPYTRAMQSAAILSRELGMDLKVEIDLYEWLPDTTFNYNNSIECSELYKDYLLCEGIYPEGKKRRWETAQSIYTRATRALCQYKDYNTVIVVCHCAVIGALTGIQEVANGQVVEYDL